jgi:uncharacterized membrane protein (UPF0127 family)
VILEQLRVLTSGRLVRAVSGIVVALACSGPARKSASNRALPPAFAAPDRVLIDTTDGKSLSVKVEVAQTPADRARGLMFRTELPAEAGMLFKFEETGHHPFWMKNTFISLDMLFIDETGRIVGIVENAEPQTTTPRDGGSSRYVLEVNGGYCASRGVKPGDRVRFER